MISEATFNVIQRAIDDEASPEELKGLEHLSARDAEVRHLYLSMKTMVEQLETVEPVNPPAHLEQTMKAAVRARSEARSRASLSERVSHLADSLFTIRIGVSFAAGLAAGLILFAATSVFIELPGGVDPADMTGSIRLNHDGEAPQVVTRTVEVSSARVNFTGESRTNQVALTVSVYADRDVGVELEYQVDEFRLEKISRTESLPGDFYSSPGKIGLNGAGDCGFTLHFEVLAAEPGPLSYNVMCSGESETGTIALEPSVREGIR